MLWCLRRRPQTRKKPRETIRLDDIINLSFLVMVPIWKCVLKRTKLILQRMVTSILNVAMETTRNCVTTTKHLPPLKARAKFIQRTTTNQIRTITPNLSSTDDKTSSSTKNETKTHPAIMRDLIQMLNKVIKIKVRKKRKKEKIITSLRTNSNRI